LLLRQMALTVIFLKIVAESEGLLRAYCPPPLRARFAHANLLPANLYCGRPALLPSGSLRSCKFAPGKFVEPGVRTKSSLSQYSKKWRLAILLKMAESEGFEPSIRFPVYTLSRGAPSATRPALLNSNCYLLTSLMLVVNMAHGARYSGRPALRPAGHQHKTLMCKIAPGNFVSHSASSPKEQILVSRY